MAQSNVFIDMTGKRFGRLLVVEIAGRTSYKCVKWKCVCDCGNIRYIDGSSLRRGITKSCGCLAKELLGKPKKHGLCYDRIYHIWRTALQRCYNPNSKGYKNYGKRGIIIEDCWHDFSTFAQWSKENGYADDLELDRINNDENYGPNNCRWVTDVEQARNRRNNTKIFAFGEVKILQVWIEDYRCNVTRWVLSRRLKQGWQTEWAIMLPLVKNGE